MSIPGGNEFRSLSEMRRLAYQLKHLTDEELRQRLLNLPQEHPLRQTLIDILRLRDGLDSRG